LKEAMHKLRGELPSGARIVLKPSWASGGDGIIVDVQEEQVESFKFPPGGQRTAILEEFIEGTGESPTLYMIGAEPCGPLADQILADNGTVNSGNRWPSPSFVAWEPLTQKCIAAARDIQRVWGLRSQWGLDFVIDRQGSPVIVDLNMGRPNGNFAVRLWESRFCQNLFLHTSSWKPPAGVTAGVFFGALRERGLAWDPAALQGVLACQHFQGRCSSYVVASACSWETVDSYAGRLQELMAELSELGSSSRA
jgi:predicted ATP-grasp superfamily ATP-dependent carboligase